MNIHLYLYRLKELEAENERLKQKVNKLTADNQSSVKQVKLTKQRTINTIREYQQLEEENNQLHRDIEDLEEHNETLQEQVQSYAVQIKDARNAGIMYLNIIYCVQGWDTFDMIYKQKENEQRD